MTARFLSKVRKKSFHGRWEKASEDERIFDRDG
jgi:hypothetical protein